MAISLDGIEENTHDMGRNVPGTFRKVMEGIARIKRMSKKPAICIQTIISGHNLKELERLIKWTKEQGLTGISFLPLRPEGEHWKELWPEKEKADVIISRIICLKENGWPIRNSITQLEAFKSYYASEMSGMKNIVCSAFETLYIKLDGEVRICQYMKPIGNVRTENIRRYGHLPMGMRFSGIFYHATSLQDGGLSFPASLISSSARLFFRLKMKRSNRPG